jgi:hypothetical protein
LQDRSGWSGTVFGRYLGLFLNQERLATLPAAGYLFSLDGTTHARTVRASPSLVELLHTAAHGSTIGYSANAGTLKPLLEDQPDEQAQYENVIAGIQNAALAFVADVLSDRPGSSHEVIAPEYAFAGLARLLKHPSMDETHILGALKIAANYGSTSAKTALTERLPTGYCLWSTCAA